jgi:hypothetical protein
LWWTPRGFELRTTTGSTNKDASSDADTLLTTGLDADGAHGKTVVAAIGVDAGKMAVYVEIVTGRRRGADLKLLSQVLSSLGCTESLFLDASLEPALGGERDLSGHPVKLDSSARHLVRRPAPGARRIFEGTEIVHPDVWAPLQRKRVRYFKKPKPAESSAEPVSGASDQAE